MFVIRTGRQFAALCAQISRARHSLGIPQANRCRSCQHAQSCRALATGAFLGFVFCRGHRPTRRGRLITATRKRMVRGNGMRQKKKPRLPGGARGASSLFGWGDQASTRGEIMPAQRETQARRGIPDRSQHRQAAERAAADIEGHSTAAELGKPGR
jgi:hypothetical protein